LLPLSTKFTLRRQQLQLPQLLISLDWSFSWVGLGKMEDFTGQNGRLSDVGSGTHLGFV
jgi:hypothetical protein